MKTINSVKQKAKLREELKNNSTIDFENLIKKTIKLDNITLLSLGINPQDLGLESAIGVNEFKNKIGGIALYKESSIISDKFGLAERYTSGGTKDLISLYNNTNNYIGSVFTISRDKSGDFVIMDSNNSVINSAFLKRKTDFPQKYKTLEFTTKDVYSSIENKSKLSLFAYKLQELLNKAQSGDSDDDNSIKQVSPEKDIEVDSVTSGNKTINYCIIDTSVEIPDSKNDERTDNKKQSEKESRLVILQSIEDKYINGEVEDVTVKYYVIPINSNYKLKKPNRFAVSLQNLDTVSINGIDTPIVILNPNAGRGYGGVAYVGDNEISELEDINATVKFGGINKFKDGGVLLSGYIDRINNDGKLALGEKVTVNTQVLFTIDKNGNTWYDLPSIPGKRMVNGTRTDKITVKNKTQSTNVSFRKTNVLNNGLMISASKCGGLDSITYHYPDKDMEMVDRLQSIKGLNLQSIEIADDKDFIKKIIGEKEWNAGAESPSFLSGFSIDAIQDQRVFDILKLRILDQKVIGKPLLRITLKNKSETELFILDSGLICQIIIGKVKFVGKLRD